MKAIANCAIMRRIQTPIFREISDAAMPKSVKRKAEKSAVYRLGEARGGAFGRLRSRAAAAEMWYFVSTSCLRQSPDTSLHLPIQIEQIVRDIAAAMRCMSPRKETYYHMTNTMRSWQRGGSHWVAVVVEIEKTGRSEATAAAAGTAVPQHETQRVYAQKNPGAPVKETHGNSLSKELFATSSSSSSSSFSISTATKVAAMASYISMSVVVTIASWLPTVLELARYEHRETLELDYGFPKRLVVLPFIICPSQKTRLSQAKTRILAARCTQHTSK
jgi:hypothetical protein